MSDFCEHGYAAAKRCPECGRSPEPGKRRSVYEDRGPVVAGDEPEQWQPIGELDPFTGAWLGAPPDFSRWRLPPVGAIRWR